MIVIITNRNVNTGRTDDRLFGEQLNTAGQNASIQAELRIATATYQRKSRSWKLTLRPEPASHTEANMPSRKLFEQVIKNPFFMKRISSGGCSYSIQMSK